MKLLGVLRSAGAIAVAASIAGLLNCASAGAQQSVPQTVQVRVTQGDVDAAAHVSNVHIHVKPSPLVKSATPPIAVPILSQPALNQILGNLERNPASSPMFQTVPDTFTLSFFPDHMTRRGGAVILTTKNHFVNVNCPSATCWGSPNPTTFLSNLGASNFVHVLDQYAGSTANNRYTLGTSVAVTYSPLFSNTLSQGDILSIVHAAAKALPGQTGYGHIYHVFLPKGLDTCFDPVPFGGGCYSPDNPSTFVFCAYHESVTFTDIGHVIYSVEPFQGPISGEPSCAIPPGSPNGQLVDSTATTLLHEFNEAVSDPDPSSGFTVLQGPQAFMEIGDVCDGVLGVTKFNTRNYETQLIYSNSVNACTNGP
jgi:hypothetical protein